MNIKVVEGGNKWLYEKLIKQVCYLEPAWPRQPRAVAGKNKMSPRGFGAEGLVDQFALNTSLRNQHFRTACRAA